MPLVEGDMSKRPKPIPFCSYMSSLRAAHGSPSFVLIDNNFKLLTNLSKDDHKDLLYDLSKDPQEKHNIVKDHPERVKEMKHTLKEWFDSCRASHAGKDYNTPFTPVNSFPALTDDVSCEAIELDGSTADSRKTPEVVKNFVLSLAYGI